MKNIKVWMKLATTVEQFELAKLADTSRVYLYHLANGKRQASATMAARIELASVVMRRKSKNRLPLLKRTNLCVACGKCPFAKGKV